MTLSSVTNANGIINATIEAACEAGNATFTLTATDGDGATTTAQLTVNVTPNTPPALSYPANPGTVYGAGLIINPLAAPADNGMLQSFGLHSVVPAINGGISVNSAGVVTVANNCGVTINPTTLATASPGVPYAQAFSASQAGAYSFTIQAVKANSTCVSVRDYTMTILPTVVPKVSCKIQNANGSYTVWFGYENTTGAADRGQTTVSQPGVVNNAFSVTFGNAGAFTSWRLRGPDGMLRGVVPSVLSPSCPQP